MIHSLIVLVPYFTQIFIILLLQSSYLAWYLTILAFLVGFSPFDIKFLKMLTKNEYDEFFTVRYLKFKLKNLELDVDI